MDPGDGGGGGGGGATGGGATGGGASGRSPPAGDATGGVLTEGFSFPSGSSDPAAAKALLFPPAAAAAMDTEFISASLSAVGQSKAEMLENDDVEGDENLQYLYTQQSQIFHENVSVEDWDRKRKGKDCFSDFSGDENSGDEVADEYDDETRIYDSDDFELTQRICDLRRKRKGEEVDLFCDSDEASDDRDMDSDCMVVSEAPKPQSINKVKKGKKSAGKGPTDRSHCTGVSTTPADFVPSSDDETFADFVDDGAEVMSWVLPTRGRKSMAKKMKERKWYDENRQQPEDQFCLQLCFSDVYQFRRAVQNFHIQQLRNYRLHRNCKDRVIVKCGFQVDESGSEAEVDKEPKKVNNCPFFMVGSVIKGEKTFCLRKMHLEHTCPTSGDNCKVTAKWVAKVSEQAFRIDPGTGIGSVMETTKEKFGVEVQKDMAYRARHKALAAVLGDQVKQYARLRDYLQAVIDSNPGSRCIVTTRNSTFHGLFMCLNACKEGFLNGCRPFIGLDGCFVKLSTGQQILAATGRDGNNNIYPIAFGLVEKEDTANWCWFLTQLKYALGGEEGKFGKYTIISDRQKGLLNAINQVFPNCYQRFCLRHMYANFQIAGFRGEELKKYMDAAAYAYTKNAFDVAMENMKEECEAAWQWLSNIPVSCWARHAMDYNCKTDLVVNNLSEVFNRMILDVRGKPVRTMFVGITTKLMTRFDGKRTKAGNARWEITPTFAEILEESKKYSKMYKSVRSCGSLWQVSRGVDKSYAVDLDKKTCGCKRWDLSGIPCHHAVSAIYKSKQQPEDFVHEFFKKQKYMEAYNPVIYPVPGEDCWRKTDTPDIEAPEFSRDVGRKQTKRRKGKFEVPAPKQTSRMGTITCSNCKLLGHRYTNCSQQLTPELQMRKNQHQSSRNAGESSSTAPPPAQDAAPPPARPAPAPPARAAPAPPAPPARAAPTARNAARAGFIAPRPAAGGTSRPRRARKPTPKVATYFNASGIDNMTAEEVQKLIGG